MSEQLFYLEDKVSDVLTDFISILNEEYKEESKELSKENIIKSIDISKHLKCAVPKGVPLFEIAETMDQKEKSLNIECHCCNGVLYSIKKDL